MNSQFIAVLQNQCFILYNNITKIDMGEMLVLFLFICDSDYKFA